MTDKILQQISGRSNTVKDPKDWTTGDQPPTGAQMSYYKTLTEEAHEDFNPNLTKAQMSEEINRLQAKVGRITPGSQASVNQQAQQGQQNQQGQGGQDISVLANQAEGAQRGAGVQPIQVPTTGGQNVQGGQGQGGQQAGQGGQGQQNQQGQQNMPNLPGVNL